MEENNTTISYYNNNADQYFQNTVHVDMSECCDKFIKYVIPGGKIIDIGAGSGRDTKYFKDRGFDVEAIDASEELCQLASKYAGVEVQCKRIQDWFPNGKYDGIWASASLLHLTREELNVFFNEVADFLAEHGVLYVSFKEGIPTGEDSFGRYFIGVIAETFDKEIADISGLHILEKWITDDSLMITSTRWVNLLLQK